MIFKRIARLSAGRRFNFRGKIHNMHLRLLRLFLGFAAFAWGISAVGVFAGWPQVNSIAQGMGAKPIAYDPMLDYWLRMVCGAFTLIGVWYLALALWPRKFSVAIPWFGWLMIAEGVILLVSGLRLGIGPFPFYGDVSACFLGGAGILFFAHSAKP
jgi:hypothetical protein